MVLVVTGPALAGDDLDAAVRNAARRQQSLGHVTELVAPAFEDDHLEASMLVEVNVERRSYPIAQPVLELRQPFRELGHPVVVDQRQGRDGRDSSRDAGTDDLSANEVAQDLRSRYAATLDDGVELLEKRPLHGDAEADELVFHDGRG